MAVLNNTASPDGRGSTQIKAVGVVLSANERTRGACRPNTSTDTFTLWLRMVDDDGDVILEHERAGLTCNRTVGTEAFEAYYTVLNCAGSEAPTLHRGSRGDITVTATTEDGTLVVNRRLKCNP
jgi:hypothetical protein